MAGVELSPMVQFVLDFAALILSPIITTSIILAKQKAVAKINQPKVMNEEITIVHTTLDEFIKSYNNSSLRNKKFQEALFRSLELSFDAVEAQTKGIRHLAESVCNGNKKAALEACDEVDQHCAEGRAVKNDVLIKQTFGSTGI